MPLRFLAALSLPLIIASTASATVQLPAEALPIAASYSPGPGTNPSLGHNGTSTAMHYRDFTSGWKVWDPASGDSTSPLAGAIQLSRCSWGGSVLFCAGAAQIAMPFPLPPSSVDIVAAYDFATGAAASATYPPNSLGAGVRDSYGNYAVVENAAGEIRFLRYNGSVSLADTLVYGGSGNGHPVVGNAYVAYQHPRVGGGWMLQAWPIDPKSPAVSQSFGNPPNPSQMRGSYVSFEWQDSVLEAYIDAGIWDPAGAAFDPVLHGCAAFRQMKKARADLTLVQGIDCPEGQSVLYAMASGPYGYQAFFVGELSLYNPEYTAREDQIAYVDANGLVQWVQADTNAFSWYLNEVEPNDNESEALELPIWQIGTGALDPKFDEEGNESPDRDFWAVDLEPGYHYTIATSVHGPGTFCAYQPPEDTDVFLFREGPEGIVLVAQNDVNAFQWVDGEWYANYCGVVELDVDETNAGRYFIEVVDGNDWVGGTDIYYLTIDRN